MNYPSTRLQNSELWRKAEAAYAANALPYHNMDHILRIYAHADALGFPYEQI